MPLLPYVKTILYLHRHQSEKHRYLYRNEILRFAQDDSKAVDLDRRIFEHKEGLTESFTKKYNVDKLVYYEVFEHIKDAIRREKQIKNLVRRKKIELIKSINPEFEDLTRKPGVYRG